MDNTIILLFKIVFDVHSVHYLKGKGSLNVVYIYKFLFPIFVWQVYQVFMGTRGQTTNIRNKQPSLSCLYEVLCIPNVYMGTLFRRRNIQQYHGLEEETSSNITI